MLEIGSLLETMCPTKTLFVLTVVFVILTGISAIGICYTHYFPIDTSALNVQGLRIASYVATAAMAMAVMVSTFMYFECNPRTNSIPPRRIMERFMAQYKQLIVKTKQPPPDTNIAIDVESLEDLVKIAAILTRPILHAADGKEDTFYIMDNSKKYQHRIAR